MIETQIHQHVNKYVRSLGRLLSKAHAASGSDCLRFLYFAHRRFAHLGLLAARYGFVPPVLAVEFAAAYVHQLKAAGYGEARIRTLTGRVMIVTHGPDGWSERHEMAH